MPPTKCDNENGFSEYRRLIISELERLDEADRENKKLLQDIHADILAIKIKIAIIAGLVGSIPSLLHLLWNIYQSLITKT